MLTQRHPRAICTLILAASLLTLRWPAEAQEIVSLSTREKVTQSYFLASVPENLQAIALLFPGSGGFIRLRKEGDQIKFGNDNFLVRSRREFMTRGVIAAIVDAPSDQQGGWGMTDEFRLGGEHFTDVAAVVADLNKRFPALGVFLIGTSRGSVSAAAVGARFGERSAGVVMTASVFRQARRNSKEPGIGLSRFDFSTVKAPLLFAHHVGDQCDSTPYSDAARLSEKYPLISVWGGTPPQSGPCDPFSQHGFFGKESETVEQIVNWMLKKPFQYEVK
jgi:hypothetical protein